MGDGPPTPTPPSLMLDFIHPLGFVPVIVLYCSSAYKTPPPPEQPRQVPDDVETLRGITANSLIQPAFDYCLAFFLIYGVRSR